MKEELFRELQRCETCKWYRYSEVDDEFVCVNRRSEYCAEQVGDYDSCGEWGRKEKDE